MIKWVPWILVALSLIAAFYMGLLLLNAGVALDDARSEGARLRERCDLALAVVRSDWLGKDVASITALSQELEKTGVIVGTEGGSFEIGDLVFETKGGVVTGVHYID